jgi:tight adherence protein B
MSALVCAAAVVLAAAAIRQLGRPGALVPERNGAVDHPARRPLAISSRAAARVVRPIGARRRRRALELAWSGVADEMAAGLRAGASLHQALATAGAREDEAGVVIRQVLGPIARGQALIEGGRDWAARATNPDELLVAEAVQLAAWTGRPEPLLFDAVADTARERLALAGELRTQTAQARASAAVLALLPIGFTTFTAATDGEAAHFLTATTAGWICIITGLTLEALGALWMRAAIRRSTL